MAPLELDNTWGLLLYGGAASASYGDSWFFVLDSSGTKRYQRNLVTSAVRLRHAEPPLGVWHGGRSRGRLDSDTSIVTLGGLLDISATKASSETWVYSSS